MDSYGRFVELAMNPKETGVFVRESIFYFKDKVRLASFLPFSVMKRLHDEFSSLSAHLVSCVYLFFNAW